MNEKMNTPRTGSASPPPSILRGGQILRIIEGRNGVPVKATTLAKELQVPRSSVVNLCVALEQIGFLRANDLGYTLGPALGELGQAFFRGFAPVRNFTEYCQRIGPLPMTVQLATLDKFEVLYLARQDSANLITIASRVGSRLPANCTALGKAMLASLDERQLERVFAAQSAPFAAFTAKSLTSEEALRPHLQKAAGQGFAIDEEETTPGIVCIAVPLSWRQDVHDAYAVSASILKINATSEYIYKAVEILAALAREISGR